MPDGKFICNMHNFIYRTYSVGEDKKINVSASKLNIELVTTKFNNEQKSKFEIPFKGQKEQNT
jgi:hypothetical protein